MATDCLKQRIPRASCSQNSPHAWTETHARITEFLLLVDSPGALDLEDLERRLTVAEEKLTAALTSGAPEDFLLDIRRDMDQQLAPYRRKMSSAQLAQLERQYHAETALGAV